MKLALGTVQFGLAYGATNGTGKVPAGEVNAILALASVSGIDLLDTAAAYGDSELVLGQFLPKFPQFRVVTKTAPMSLQSQPQDVQRVLTRVRQSLQQLQLPQLSALLVHHAQDLLGEQGDALFAGLQSLQREGLLGRLGVSVYTTAELDAVTQRYPIQIVQLPLNVLDHSFLAGQRLALLKRQGIEIHSRSAFLQGILLQPSLPDGLAELAIGMNRFRQLCEQYQMEPLVGCLRFLRQQRALDEVLVGVTSRSELQQIAQAWQQAADLPTIDFSVCNMAPHRMLSPANWPPRSSNAS